MCRILFLKGTNKELALQYLEAFKNAGCNDPYLESVAKLLNVPGIKNQHIHGWGYLFVRPDDIYLYKTGKFV
jgi:predicted glutamine amidotransferase